MKHLRISSIFTLFATLCISGSTLACTDFRVTAKDGTVLITRSMEYAVDMKANLRTSPRGRVYNTVAPDGKPGMSWTAKNGYVFLDAFNTDFAIDGMNEKGLSFEALYLPNLAQYQTVPMGHNNQAIPYLNLGDWILSSFDNIDQVRSALVNVYAFPQKVPGMDDMIFPLHFSIFDASGKGIVVEYINGKLNLYDHLGVMTNSPSYDWHITNMANYVHLAPVNPAPVVANGVTFAANGQGFGMLGMPGDISPPSRFVKTATLAHVALPVDDAVGALNLAEHIINNVDIPLGLVREPVSGNYINELTQWVVFKDLTHKTFYYRTYNNLTLRGVPLAKLNFADNAPRLMMPIASTEYVIDVSSTLLKAVQPVTQPMQPVTSVTMPSTTTPAPQPVVALPAKK